MLLTPSAAPPLPNSAFSDKDIVTIEPTTTHVFKPLNTNSPVHPHTRWGDAATEDSHACTADDFLEQLKVPTVVLETSSISHTMAAALSLSLLGHTLFLKSQVPFPVAQLSRMPGGKSSPKVTKKRDELLATFDTLASHLHTTFVSLSSAYAKCKSSHSKAPESGENLNVAIHPQGNNTGEPSRGTAHLMFVLGPSVGAARARVLLTIDGLEVKVWGSRGGELTKEPDIGAVEDEEGVGEDSSEEEASVDEDEEDTSGEEDADSSEEDDSSEQLESDEEDEGSDSDGSEPPPSRSPSLCTPPTRSLAPSPESLPSPPIMPTPLAFPQSLAVENPSPTISPSSSSATASKPQPPTTLTPPAPTSMLQERLSSREVTPTLAAPELSYAEEQQSLRAAERLLSRTLMKAWVDGGGDMSSELAPTQTHIYLRAPRRFAHPAWAARQNLARALDAMLYGFLEDAGAVPTPQGAKGKVKSRGVRTEGAWIGCRGGSAFAAKSRSEQNDGNEEADAQAVEGDEDDEEIWWAWDGKLVGFADW